MLRITGYSDRYSIRPGDDITFYVNSEKDEDYEAKLVRLIHGDTNPDGPGYKEEEIDAPFDGSYTGRNQKIHGGSYVIVPHDERMSVSSFTIQAFIFPTTPTRGRQGILTKWVNDTGYGLFVDDDGCLAVCIGDGNNVHKLSSGKPLLRKVWYLAAASYDAESGAIHLYQEPVVTSANGGLGMALLHPAEETSAEVSDSCSIRPSANDAPFLMAASTQGLGFGPLDLWCALQGGADPGGTAGAVRHLQRQDRPPAGSPLPHSASTRSMRLARGFKGCPADLRRACGRRLGLPGQHHQEHRIHLHHRYLAQRAERLCDQPARARHDWLQLDRRRDRLSPRAGGVRRDPLPRRRYRRCPVGRGLQLHRAGGTEERLLCREAPHRWRGVIGHRGLHPLRGAPAQGSAVSEGRGDHPDQQLSCLFQRQPGDQLGGGAAAGGQGAADAGLRPLPQRASRVRALHLLAALGRQRRLLLVEAPADPQHAAEVPPLALALALAAQRRSAPDRLAGGRGLRLRPAH